MSCLKVLFFHLSLIFHFPASCSLRNPTPLYSLTFPRTPCIPWDKSRPVTMETLGYFVYPQICLDELNFGVAEISFTEGRWRVCVCEGTWCSSLNVVVFLGAVVSRNFNNSKIFPKAEKNSVLNRILGHVLY